jgi:phage shock protein PspC (stress-responsive transcriptional regulator)
MKEKRLYRSCKNRIIGGVCGGLGEYFEIDPVLIRLIVALLFFTGVSIIFYILAWIIIPEEPTCSDRQQRNDPISSDVKKASDKTEKIKDINESRLVVGAIIILIGILFLFQNILGFKLWETLWPLILVFLGLFFIFKAQK